MPKYHIVSYLYGASKPLFFSQVLTKRKWREDKYFAHSFNKKVSAKFILIRLDFDRDFFVRNCGSYVGIIKSE